MVTPKIHAAIVASPGMGHLIPTMELAKRLATHHGFEVTIFIVTATTTTAGSLDSESNTTKSNILQQTSNLNSLKSLNIIVTPFVDVSDKLDPNKPSLLGQRIMFTLIESLPFIRSQILSMKFPPSVLIVDIFSSIALPMARDLHMSSYVFFSTNAWFTAVTIHIPFMTKEVLLKHANDHEPLLIPGCESIQFEDTLETLVSPCGSIHEGLLNMIRDMLSSDGILINTWQDLEPAATKAVVEHDILGRFTKGPVYLVGPLVRNNVEQVEKREGENLILSWLDKQPVESVIFLSFGSGGTMSECQMKELAYGLELSKQRFIWVVRQPTEGDASAAFFEVKGCDGLPIINYLPDGFVSRTKDVGLCVTMWAPQAEILKHPAIGGFVTHCGWNSVLESILNGVPMVAWPLYSEQKMNATILSKELGVAVKVKATATEKGAVVCRKQIAELICRVMVDEEGIAMRVKVKDYKLSGAKAISVFGSSHESLCRMTKDCVLHMHNSEAKSSWCLDNN
jgi:coniferyl-alcohol glucosyltransferase